MDFEKFLQNDMEDVAKKVEAGLEDAETKGSLTKEDVESIVKFVVHEELADAIKTINKYIDKKINIIIEKKQDLAPITQTSNQVIPNIDIKKNVKYNVLEETRYTSSMTCGGWIFFENKKEGSHLWAVNDEGTEYCELYPKTISMVTKVEDGYVYFTDADYNHLRVCIGDGKIEKVKGYSKTDG